MRASHGEAPAGDWQVPGERRQGISFLFLPRSKATFLTEVPSLHADGSMLWTLRPPRLQLSLSSSNTVLSLYAFSPTGGNGFLLLLVSECIRILCWSPSLPPFLHLCLFI